MKAVEALQLIDAALDRSEHAYWMTTKDHRPPEAVQVLIDDLRRILTRYGKE